MEIVITSTLELNTQYAILYSRVFREVCVLVQKKDPNAPHMFITLDASKCDHDYRFTGAILINSSAVAMCNKCKNTIIVRQKK